MGAGDALRMHYYFPGMIVGIILLQTSIVAPTLFKKLNIEDFGRAIRALWPKFFIMLAIFGWSEFGEPIFRARPNNSAVRNFWLNHTICIDLLRNNTCNEPSY